MANKSMKKFRRKSKQYRKSKQNRRTRSVRKLKGGNNEKTQLINKLNDMLMGKNHMTTAEDFVDEVINTLCEANNSPKRKKSNSPIMYGPDGTPYEDYVSQEERRLYNSMAPKRLFN